MMKLYRETRWLREYRNKDGTYRSQESRFLDGTATITLVELRAEWLQWNEMERLEFCSAFTCGSGVPDQVDILRFLIEVGDHYESSTIATSLARDLPKTEAVAALKEWCLSGEHRPHANYYQALALTKSPEALEHLRICFARDWKADGLMADANFQNWHAYDAICCIKYMLELGEDPAKLSDAFEILKAHPCAGTRDAAQRFLAKHFESAS